MRVLKETSRTFYIPIALLKRTLKLTVGSAYLCMRAIDEIEDHETMDATIKIALLQKTKSLLEAYEAINRETHESYVAPSRTQLRELTLRLADWDDVCR